MTPAGQPARRRALGAVWTSASEFVRRRKADPWLYVPWLPNQWRFLASRSKVKQIRQGNQWGGKTWAALAEVIGRCLGKHPLGAHGFAYPTPGPGFEAWVICDSWSQAVAIQGKFWALVPKGELKPGTVFTATRGFKGKNPVVEFRNGVVVRFKTANQDPKSLASGTIDLALFDEPPPNERVYTEVLSRLQQKNGTLILSYTPVNAPVAYLREFVDKGMVEDFWSPLTPEALIPVGWDRPMVGIDGRVRDEAWIAEVRATVPEYQQPVVVDGEWEFRAAGAYFEGAWNPATMVHGNAPAGIVKLHLGIDHGDRPGKQCAYLIAVDEAHASGWPAYYVVDEYVDDTGTALPEDDAKNILAMLTRNGLQWAQLDGAAGDRAHAPGRAQQKSNLDLAAQIAKLLKVARGALRPDVRTAKRGEGRGKGSAGVRSRWLFHQMVRGVFAVHPRCKRLLEAIPKYRGPDFQNDDAKDPIDAIVYGLDSYVYNQWRRGTFRPVRAW